MATELDYAWLAGFFDGEGCIEMSQRRPGQSFRVTMTIVNTDRCAVDRCYAIAGGHLGGPEKKRRDAWKRTWRWRAYDSDVKRILEHLLPYLTVKKAQAMLAIQFPMSGCRSNAENGRRLPAGPLTKLGQAVAFKALRGIRVCEGG